MKKITLLLICTTFMLTGTAFASSYIDFTQVQLKSSHNATLSNSSSWEIGVAYSYSEGKVTALSPVEPYYGHPVFTQIGGWPIFISKVGLTKDDGETFSPSPTPVSCQVGLHDTQRLCVYGSLYVPGTGQTPYIENLHCKVTDNSSC